MQVFGALLPTGGAMSAAFCGYREADDFSGLLVADDGIGQSVFVQYLQKPDLGFGKNRFQVASGSNNTTVIFGIEAFGNIEIGFGFAYDITQVNH